MKKRNFYKGHDISSPGNLNIIIALLSMSACVVLLHFASNNNHFLITLLCAALFSLTANTVFGLVHEAVHAVFHKNKKINYIFGVITTAFFPTGYTFQKKCHLNHHRQNRTDYEMFEAYHEGDSKFFKQVMLYCILTGVYWAMVPVGAFWLMLHPESIINGLFSGKKSYKLGRMGGAGMLRHLENASAKEMKKIRLEILFALCLQVSLVLIFNISALGWIICYASFAVAWSGLQYADHAYSARDIRHGAWNLKVNKVSEKMYLNYHHHLAHHQHPHVPWIHLAKFVDFSKERPTYMSIYLKMWKGIVKVEKVTPKLEPELANLIALEPFLK
jgi:fatty acid desaturase